MLHIMLCIVLHVLDQIAHAFAGFLPRFYVVVNSIWNQFRKSSILPEDCNLAGDCNLARDCNLAGDCNLAEDCNLVGDCNLQGIVIWQGIAVF